MGLDLAVIATLAVFLIFAGAMLLVLRNRRDTKGGMLIMIGPIPIVIGSGVKMVRALLLVGAVIFLILFAMQVI